MLPWHQKLQLMTIGIVKINAVRITGAAVNFDAGIFENRFDPRVISRGKLERHVVHLAAAMDLGAVFRQKERDSLIAALEKDLPGALVVDFHAEKVDIEFSRASEILHMKHDVVDTGDFQWSFHGAPP